MTHPEHDLESFSEEIESTEVLMAGLTFLLRRHLRGESNQLTKRIVTQLERLLRHRDCIGFENERCSYYRLLSYWRAKAL